MFRNKNNAFTLIELLVVISIIAILMADIGNDNHVAVAPAPPAPAVSSRDYYTNHFDGIAFLHFAGNVNFHRAANSVIFNDQRYDDGPVDDGMPDSLTDTVILPIR